MNRHPERWEAAETLRQSISDLRFQHFDHDRDEREAQAKLIYDAMAEREKAQREKISELKGLGQLLLTQDNRCTKAPMFCVQKRICINGMDPEYAESFVWRNMDSGDYEECEEGDPGAEKVYYVDRWETVMVTFSELGCQQYIDKNGHNLGETRIYVESFQRCQEMLAIREFLLLIAE